MEKQLCIQTKNIPLKTCAFTGHRELGGEFSAQKLYEAIQKLVERGVEIFYNGMAKGFDLLAAEAVASIKKTNPQIKLIACIPCVGQDKYYSERDKSRYAAALRRADETVFISENYFNGCMQKRDRYMADRADVMIAYCKKDTGGTAYTVKYFEKKYPEKEIVFLT